jgi:hypothetical protein
MNNIKMKTITTIVALLVALTIHGQSIENFSIDSGGASESAGGIEILYTIGEVNVQELSAGGISVSEGFINANFRIQIDPKVFLQGPLLNPATAGLMNDNLRSSSSLPTTSPYNDNANAVSSVFAVTGNNAIVDWVWVELRAANDNTKLINARSALLQRDGDIVDLDGVSNLLMTAAPTNYFVVIKHRNHIGAMSSQFIALSENTATVVDFKNASFSTFGAHAQVVLNSGDTALWSGDVNSDGLIRSSGSNNDVNAIKDFILADPLNILNFITFSSTGYLFGDLNMDGVMRFSGAPNDSNTVKDNVLAHPGNILGLQTFTISEQVPNN